MKRILITNLACAAAIGLAGPAAAQTVWTMPTEYPATAMPGEGVAAFAENVKTLTDGKLVIKPSFDGAAGIKSAQMIDAVGEGKVEAGDAFGGALRAVDPIFGLSSLPFVATSIDDARRLAETARPAYEAAFEKRGQRLLYMTPWPASGIWSKAPLQSMADIKSLAIRTYDDTSTEVMSATGANATKMSWSDALPKLRSGDANAVLSSGDGGAGRKLWEILPGFAEVTYAMPLSFATVNTKAFDALTPELQAAVTTAAEQTQASQWQAMQTRVAENYERMRENGVQIQTDIPPDIRTALNAAASDVVQKWQAESEQGAAILKKFQQ